MNERRRLVVVTTVVTTLPPRPVATTNKNRAFPLKKSMLILNWVDDDQTNLSRCHQLSYTYNNNNYTLHPRPIVARHIL